MRTKITQAAVAKAVRQAVDAGRTVDLFDTLLHRFFLRVRKTGTSGWYVRWQDDAGKERRLKVGDAGTMTVAAARKRAQRLLGQVDNGDDPGAERRTKRNELRLSDIWDAYTASTGWKAQGERTRKEKASLWTRHLKPRVGALRLSEVDVQAARRMVADITESRVEVRTARGTRTLGGEGAARHAARLLSALMSFCVDTGRLPVNPLRGTLRIGDDGRRDITPLTPAQYRRMFAVMEEMESRGELRPEAHDALKFIALTGCRKSEAQRARRKHLDTGGEQWRVVIPPAESKTGKRTGKPRVIPVPTQAQQTLRRGDADPEALLFAGKAGKSISLTREWQRIREAAGLPDGLGIHGLRHSFASRAAMAGASAFEIAQAVGHASVTTTQRYVHLAGQVRSIQQELADSLADTDSASVVPLRKKA